ncbi:MAG TPA: solute:sodium symporter (SSS) family transporter [Peptococcaceae bacterium]|nr:solute:sodium symporter (SSS) family transporter [Peptococcaceae bacterium]
MGNLSSIDYIIIILYMSGMLVIGYALKGKINDSDDFYIAGRSLNFFVIAATVCASIIGGSALIGRGGVMYDQGIIGVMLAIPYLLGMYFFSFISGRIQKIGVRYNISSIPDLMEFRFGKAARYLTSGLIGFTMMATVGSQITALATVIKITGGFSYEFAAWFSFLIIISYTVFSGFYGVVYTDVAQFFVLLATVYIILPIKVVKHLGGIGEMIRAMPSRMLTFNFTPEIIGWIFTSLIFTFAGAEMWQRSFASKSPQAATRGMLIGTTIYGITILVTVILSFGSYLLIPDIMQTYGSADAAIPALAIKILPTGVLGLAFAGIIAVIMSTADTYLLMSVQTVVGDIIKPLKNNLTPSKEILYSRIGTGIIGILALVISLYNRQVYRALMFAWTFYAASVGMPAIAALYWKKATSAGIIGGMIAGFSSSILWSMLGAPFEISPAIVGSVLCFATLFILSRLTFKADKPSPFPS